MAGNICLAETVAEHIDAGFVDRFHELAAELVIDVYHRVLQVRPMEELRLGGAVIFHGLVIVEVIARKVGEQCRIEFDAIDATLVDAMRRNFHCAAHDPVGMQSGQLRLQRNCVRRGVHRGVQRSRESASQRADHSGLPPQSRQRLRDPVRA